MKFSLASALLAFCLIAVLLGWYAEHIRRPSDAEMERQIADSVQLGIVVGCAINSNEIYERLGKATKSDFEKNQTKELVENVLDMALCDLDTRNHAASWAEYSDKASVPDSETFIHLASKSLQLLSVNSIVEFEQLLAKNEVSQTYGGENVIVNGAITSEIAQFVKRALPINKERRSGADKGSGERKGTQEEKERKKGDAGKKAGKKGDAAH